MKLVLRFINVQTIIYTTVYRQLLQKSIITIKLVFRSFQCYLHMHAACAVI